MSDLEATQLSTKFVFMTDSSYLAKRLANHVWTFVENGFRNARGQPVVNGAAFEALHEKTSTFEMDGLDLSFWQVPREGNRDADRLAIGALRSGERPRAVPGKYYYQDFPAC